MSKFKDIKAPNLKLISTSNEMVELNKLKSKFIKIISFNCTSTCIIFWIKI